MARDITAAVVTRLQESVVRPVLIVRLDIASDPLTAWTGPGVFSPSATGDSALDSQIFVPVAPITNVTPITEDKGIGGPVTLAISGHDLDEDLLRQIVRDKRVWRGRNAWLWLGLINTDQKTVLADPFRLKTGVIVNITTNRSGSDSIVNVIIDRDLCNAVAPPFRYIDHPRFYPADTFGTFLAKLINKPSGIASVPADFDAVETVNVLGERDGEAEGGSFHD